MAKREPKTKPKAEDTLNNAAPDITTTPGNQMVVVDPFVHLPKKFVEPDEAFFATLPEGFVPGRKADYLGDVITSLSDFLSDPEKVIWLRHNDGPALRYILRLAFCQDVEWLIPAGLPVFKAWKGRRHSAPSELKRECRRLYLFLKGGNDKIADEKRQKLFQQTIEGLEPSELGVLTSIKDHTLDADYGLTEELTLQAFPGILSAPFIPKFIR